MRYLSSKHLSITRFFIHFNIHDPEEEENTILHSSGLRKGEANHLIGSILTSDVGVLVQSINPT